MQENYKVADKVAPYVDKIRYNPGHLHHIDKRKTVPEKVKWLVDVARDNNVAIRIGVNCGSVAPSFLEKYPGDQLKAIVESAAYHCELMEEFGFDRFVVSLKDSDPAKVMDANRRFTERRPDVPLHLGVTEAGLPPDGIIKTRIAFEKLLAQRIGETIRVSLTLPNERKHEESYRWSQDHRGRRGRALLFRCRISARASTSFRARHAPGSRTSRFVELAQQGQGDDRLRDAVQNHHRDHGF